MKVPGSAGEGPQVPAPQTDFAGRVAALLDAGAARYDPPAVCYINHLAARARDQAEPVRSLVEAKLASAIVALERRFWAAHAAAMEAAAKAAQRFPASNDALLGCLASGDFKAVHRIVAVAGRQGYESGLAALTRQLSGKTGDATCAAAVVGGKPELKTARYFRQTWSAISVYRQVDRALERAPANAGPLNSHRLVVCALAMMRDISPEYLSRFVSYADTLLSLEPSAHKAKAKPGRTAGACRINR